MASSGVASDKAPSLNGKTAIHLRGGRGPIFSRTRGVARYAAHREVKFKKIPAINDLHHSLPKRLITDVRDPRAQDPSAQ